MKQIYTHETLAVDHTIMRFSMDALMRAHESAAIIISSDEGEGFRDMLCLVTYLRTCISAFGFRAIQEDVQ